MAPTLTYLRNIARRVRTCPACGTIDWVDLGYWDRPAVLPDPDAHAQMPAEFPLYGIDVVPAVCRHCGYVAPFSKTVLSSDVAAA